MVMGGATIRHLFWAISIVLFILGLFLGLVWVGTLSFSNAKEAQPVISIIWSILGATWASLGIILALQQLKILKPKHTRERRPFFEHPLDFINRKEDLRGILDGLGRSKLHSVYGQRGVGKSDLLKYLSDIVNGHPAISYLPTDLTDQVKQLGVSSALYVDLVDTAGWDQSLEQISQACGFHETSSTLDLIQKLNERHKQNKIVLILDNLNNEGARLSALNQLGLYGTERPEDKVVIGSVAEIFDPRFDATSSKIDPFPEIHCKAFLERRRLPAAPEQVERAYMSSAGLPLFLKLLAANQSIGTATTETFSGYFIHEIYSRIRDDDKEFLLFLSVCNIAVTSIGISELYHAGISAVDSKIRRLQATSSIIVTSDGVTNEVKVHDLIRDIILDQNLSMIPIVASKASRFVRKINRLSSSILSSLAHEGTKQKEQTDELISELGNQIGKSNYSFLLAFWQAASLWADAGSIFYKEKELRKQAILGYLAALLGTGQYPEAKRLASLTTFSELFPNRVSEIVSEQEFKLQYLLVDLDHLLNQYDLARSFIVLLEQRATKFGWVRQECEAIWMYAHLCGHIGDDLEEGLAAYDRCSVLASENEHIDLYVRAEHGKSSLLLATKGSSSLKPELFDELVKTAKQAGIGGLILSAIYRNKCRYLRQEGELEASGTALAESLSIARQSGLRTMINCDYAKGDLLRAQSKYEQAITHYELVEQATRLNQDDNLRSSAMLAKLICQIELKLEVDRLAEMVDAIAEIMELASTYKMHVTDIRARLVRFNLFSRFGQKQMESEEALLARLTQLGLERDKHIFLARNGRLNQLEIHVH